MMQSNGLLGVLLKFSVSQRFSKDLEWSFLILPYWKIRFIKIDNTIILQLKCFPKLNTR